MLLEFPVGTAGRETGATTGCVGTGFCCCWMSASAYPVIAPNIAVVERPNTKIFAARAGRGDFFVVCDATDVAGESPDAGAIDWRSDFSCSNMARRSTDLCGCDLVTCGLSTEGGVGGAHG